LASRIVTVRALDPRPINTLTNRIFRLLLSH
jgi:hypothetical protein